MSTYENAWIPTQDMKKSTRLYQWMNKLGFNRYEDFYEQSVKKIDWFWDAAVKEMDIDWYTPYQKTLNLSRGIMYPQWFEGGKLNVAHLALDRWAQDEEMKNEVALLWEGDNGDTASYTFHDLQKEVDAVAYGLEQYNITPEDIVTLYMPMIPETLISMLAISKIGAIFSPAFSGYKADAVATRIQASRAKALITADGFFRRGKTISMKDEADLAADQSPSLEHVFVVERAGIEVDWNKYRDVAWSNLRKNETVYKTKVKKADDPYMLIYTSGTTGKPKGAVHTHAGFPIKAAFDAGICMDVQKRDTLFWYTDMGWMMGPFLVYGGLVNGASIVMFEGTPDYPEPDRLWNLVEKYQVTHLGISPTLVRSMMKHGEDWIKKHDLHSLKLIGSTGEPWNPEPWNWLFKHAGDSKVPIFNYSGGTEISGGILGNVLLKPIQPVTFNAALPGMDVDVFDDQGNPVFDHVGELVIKQPWVGMTNSFFKDDERYEQTYWSRFKDTWVHGDWVIRDKEGYYTITGRSDDVLNVAGKRLGPAEVESVLVEHKDVIESGVIGIPHEVKGEEPVAFIVLSNKKKNTNELLEELLLHLDQKLGKALAPKKLFIVDDLPKTRNAKVMRRAIKSAYLNRPSGDLSALENPESVNQIKSIGQNPSFKA
ncbi:acetyl-CoA synthetase [Halobacillus karajensis]|uniref:acetate--CoA ligase n=1 Tax=Halobacillus karajensis TaxID=195088 RepID=A0A024P1A6_9BACI|nr:AMP-binding protein [Halobacillus karajensis]CDQ19604.1 Acetyl-coenzyme A synthetase [Halobacillus karajensis]CDQ22064.1 Acetyl-coenzyme A synthetase [Halobacillus karajensis]CDQ27905.1 Acetyl-coenzyme A synthetase [Halobacillus karajensis]SEH79655.1 acetyl-CoA synthetase [Halobacillus karajensis]